MYPQKPGEAEEALYDIMRDGCAAGEYVENRQMHEFARAILSAIRHDMVPGIGDTSVMVDAINHLWGNLGYKEDWDYPGEVARHVSQLVAEQRKTIADLKARLAAKCAPSDAP